MPVGGTSRTKRRSIAKVTPISHGAGVTRLKLTRRILLMMLLAAPGASGEPYEPVQGVTRVEKLAFLLERILLENRVLPKEVFGFEAYDFGPFSSQVYGDLEFLSQQGLMSEVPGPPEPEGVVESESALRTMLGASADESQDAKEPVFSLNSQGQALAAAKLMSSAQTDPETREAMRVAGTIKAAFAQRPLSDLISYVYRRYPDYAEKSTIRHRFLGR